MTVSVDIVAYNLCGDCFQVLDSGAVLQGSLHTQSHRFSQKSSLGERPVHRGVLCLNCDRVIIGVRHTCRACPGSSLSDFTGRALNECRISILDANLCSSCIQHVSHPHPFIEVTRPATIEEDLLGEHRELRNRKVSCWVYPFFAMV